VLRVLLWGEAVPNEVSSQPRLVLSEPGAITVFPLENGTVFPLPEGRTLIGRAKRNDLVIKHVSVSRFHCQLEREGDEVRVHDSMSRNATTVNGRAADGERLEDGDTLALGRCRFTYRGPPARKALDGALRPGGAVPLRPPRRPLRRSSMGPMGPVVALSGIALLVIIAGLIVSHELRRPEVAEAPGAGGLSAERAAPARGAPRPAAEPSGHEARLLVLQGELDRTREEMGRLETLIEELRAGRAGSAAIDDRLHELEVLEGKLARSLEERGRLEARLVETAAHARELERAGDVSSSEHASPVTEVLKPAPAAPQAATARTAKEVAALVAALRRTVEDYGNPETTPRSLEPHLSDLTAANGEAAAAGVIEVYDLTRKLVADLDASLRMNERRKAELLAEADLTRDKLPDEGAGSYRKHGHGLELKQRALELSDKAISILEEQRKSLVALQEAVLASMKRLGSPEATRFLIRKLDHRDHDLRRAVQAALAAIAGEDLGPERASWERWWEKRQDG
jgi:hypothetical protein